MYGTCAGLFACVVLAAAECTPTEGSDPERTWTFVAFSVTGVLAAWLMRRLWFHGRGGRGTRLLMASSAALAILLGYDVLAPESAAPCAPVPAKASTARESTRS